MRKGFMWILLSVWLFVCPAAAEGVNRALLIGCDRFLSMEDTSPAAANNVSMMADALSGGAMSLAQLVTQRRGIPDEQTLVQLMMDAFEGSVEEDTCYFYLSTHGILDEDNQLGFLLSDGIHESVLSAERLHTLLSGYAGRKVILLDACHSGAIIGKGMEVWTKNWFAGENAIVFCSSGGAEASWLWTAADGSRDGTGYFTRVLANALSAEGGFAADENADGQITADELYRYVAQHDGASVPRMYPEESEEVLLTYSVEAYRKAHLRLPVDGISFENGVLSTTFPEISFSFTATRPVRVAYRITCMRGGEWAFNESEAFMDTSESEDGWLNPGWKERRLTLDAEEAEGGYALLEIFAMADGRLTLAASHVICVLPAQEMDPMLKLSVPSEVNLSSGEELAMMITHACPCLLTVMVEDEQGQLLRSLLDYEPTRPQAVPGTAFTWSGLLEDNQKAAPGMVRIRVQAEINDMVYEALSDAICIK